MLALPHPAPHLIPVGRITAYLLHVAENGLQGALADLYAERQRIWLSRADACARVRLAARSLRDARLARGAYIIALGDAYEAQRRAQMHPELMRAAA